MLLNSNKKILCKRLLLFKNFIIDKISYQVKENQGSDYSVLMEELYPFLKVFIKSVRLFSLQFSEEMEK